MNPCCPYFTPEERADYFTFIGDQMSALGALSPHYANELLWHYTTIDSAIKIIEGQSIFATQVACLNDSTEIARGLSMLREEVLRLTPKSADKNEERILEFIQNAFKHEQDRKEVINSPWYVSCFTRRRDDLSQWRAYGPSEQGCAIAFRARDLIVKDHFLVKVNYEQELQRQIARTVAEKTVQFCLDGYNNRCSIMEFEDWMREFFVVWSFWIDRLAPVIKNPSFSAEEEFRIMLDLKNSKHYSEKNLQFGRKSSLVSRHLPLNVREPSFMNRQLPILNVMVGPSRNKDVTKASLEALLRKHEYSAANDMVSLSAVPFQNV